VRCRCPHKTGPYYRYFVSSQTHCFAPLVCRLAPIKSLPNINRRSDRSRLGPALAGLIRQKVVLIPLCSHDAKKHHVIIRTNLLLNLFQTSIEVNTIRDTVTNNI
jgi:hypothetical protein